MLFPNKKTISLLLTQWNTEINSNQTNFCKEVKWLQAFLHMTRYISRLIDATIRYF